MTEVVPRPLKQEQLPASDEILEIAPGVLRAQLPISIPGLGHVNMYILEDEMPSSNKALRARSKAASLEVLAATARADAIPKDSL